jgi:hypothetical protein
MKYSKIVMLSEAKHPGGEGFRFPTTPAQILRLPEPGLGLGQGFAQNDRMGRSG